MVEIEKTEVLPSPCNGGCDKANVCHFATKQCSLPIDSEFKPKQPVILSVAPSRRYCLCQGYAETLGISFFELKEKYKKGER